MTIIAEYMPKCDECGVTHAGLASFTKEQARQEAKRHGWKRNGKKDICPDCLDQKTETKDDPADDRICCRK